MQAFAMVDPATVSGKTKDLLDRVVQRIGRVPKMIRLLANSPAATEAYIQLNVCLSQAELAQPIRSLIAVAVAEANGCAYSAMIAQGQARHAGVSEDEIELARDAKSHNVKTAAVLRFAVDLVESRGKVDASHISLLRTAGCHDAEIVEIVATVILSLYRNYFNLVAGTEIDDLGPAARPASFSGLVTR